MLALRLHFGFGLGLAEVDGPDLLGAFFFKLRAEDGAAAGCVLGFTLCFGFGRAGCGSSWPQAAR